jgi:DNA-directed RNA polymerase subunit F
MIGEKLISQKPVSLADVKQLLADRKKDKDLSYEQDITLKYAKRFGKISLANAEKLEGELKGIEGLNPETITKVIDILPDKKEKLQLLIPKDVVLNEEAMQKMLDLCRKYGK